MFFGSLLLEWEYFLLKVARIDNHTGRLLDLMILDEMDLAFVRDWRCLSGANLGCTSSPLTLSLRQPTQTSACFTPTACERASTYCIAQLLLPYVQFLYHKGLFVV